MAMYVAEACRSANIFDMSVKAMRKVTTNLGNQASIVSRPGADCKDCFCFHSSACFTPFQPQILAQPAAQSVTSTATFR
jgi:hypothetical protein